MGVKGLSAWLKPIASEWVDLNNGVGTIIYDGHASMHRAASRGNTAAELVLKGNVRALVLGMLPEMLRFELAGWDVVVVFDGATPPGKARASKSRSGERAKAIEVCRYLQAERPVNQFELKKHARGAVEFTSETVAKVSAMLKHSLRAECITAPFEADSQLKIMEDLYSRPGQSCFVRANDSDLTVLGVRSVLWDVKMEEGGLIGQCIRLDSILQPQVGVFSNSSPAFDFLRRLHGVRSPAIDDPAQPAWSPNEGGVMTRLRNFACVAGNDYSKFKGVGPMSAMDIAIPDGDTLSTLQVAVELAEKTSSKTEVVLPQLKTSVDMFCHAVVWDPLTGTHKHLSGIGSTADITNNTGTPASHEVASKIAAQEICPKTHEPWTFALSMEGLPPLIMLSGVGGRAEQRALVGGGREGRGARARGGRAGRAASPRGGRAGRGASPRGGRAGQGSSSGGERAGLGEEGGGGRGGRGASARGRRTSQGTRRNPPLGGAEGDNYRRTGGFGNLPGADMDYSSWTVEQLREFLSAFRCLEMSGVSKFCKAQLATLAKTCVEVVRQAGLEGSELAFRHPVRAIPAPHQPGAFPPPETVWLGWEALRENLPELSDNIIIRWLKEKGSLKGSTGRVLYRGLQRVLDLGALGGLVGVPCAVEGGPLHLRFLAAGSMRDVQYEVSATLEVEKVDEVDNTGNIDDLEGVVDADTCRYVATKVIQASCTCQSGAGGGCHHVCQLLQLTRLLQLTEIELGSWNPKSPTSVACQWVLKNCGAGRNREQNIMHCEPMEDIARSLRTLRDPKTHPFMGGEPVKTRGVVAINRADDYSSHPDFGVWAEPKRIFDQGGPHNQLECVRLKKLVDGQRREFKRFKPDGRPSASVFSEVCLDRQVAG